LKPRNPLQAGILTLASKNNSDIYLAGIKLSLSLRPASEITKWSALSQFPLLKKKKKSFARNTEGCIFAIRSKKT
jgi:hypothetical protein